MKRLKEALESLDDAISFLEDQIGGDAVMRRDLKKKDQELLKLSRAREASVLAVAQKVAARLDHTIDHVDNIIRN